MANSTVKVNYAIVHNVKKEQRANASLELSQTCFDASDEKTIDLIAELNNRYKENITYGHFIDDDQDSTSFEKELTTYIGKRGTTEFIEMTKKTVSLLRVRMDSETLAKGGYVIYSDYTEGRNHYFAVFLIRDKNGKVFKKSHAGFTIQQVVHVDTERLAVACRVNIPLFKKKDGWYLGFINIRQPETSEYFRKWINAEKAQKSDDDSKFLVRIINEIDPPEEDGKVITRDELRSRAFDHIKAYGKGNMPIRNLSKALFNDEDTIQAFAEKNDWPINSEFVPSKKQIAKLLKTSARGDNIDIKFPPSYYGDQIKIDPNDPSLVVIRSINLARSIKEESQ